MTELTTAAGLVPQDPPVHPPLRRNRQFQALWAGLPALRVLLDILILRQAPEEQRGQVVAAVMTLMAAGLPAGSSDHACQRRSKGFIGPSQGQPARR